MQPPLRVADADAPGFTAVNQATTLVDPGPGGFAVNRAEWGVAASDDQRTAALANFALKLTYTIQQDGPMRLYAPAQGHISFFPPVMDGDQIRSRSFILSFALNTEAMNALHVGGRDQDEKEPAPSSPLHRCRLGGRALDVRLLFTIATPALDLSLRDRLKTLYAAGTLRRDFKPNTDLRLIEGHQQVVDLPAADPETRHLQPWWNGISLVPWYLKGSDDEDWLLTMQKNDSIVVQAALREAANVAPTGHWYLCNPGYVLRALGVAGDPARPENDKAYGVISGNCVWPIASGGTVASDGTNPADSTKLGIDDVFVVYGGSMRSVVLQPPSDAVVPGCLFSFSSAEDVNLYSPKLENRRLGLRVWQPTVDGPSLAPVQQKFGAAVVLPAANEVILVTEYSTAAGEAPARATTYPGNREGFMVSIADAYAYHGSRARPPATTAAFEIPGRGDWTRTININETDQLRPEHRAWKGQRGSQIRRLFPLCLELQDVDTAGAPRICLLTQDDVDCIRQEYAFHLKWTGNYYQQYTDIYDTPAKQAANVHGVDDDRITLGGDGLVTGPSLGSQRFFMVPRRIDVRPLAKLDPALATSYRYTLLMDSWKDRRQEVTDPGTVRATRIKQILDDPVTRDEIMTWLGTSTYNDPILPRYAAEVAALIGDMLDNPEPLQNTNMRGFLCYSLKNADPITRLDELRARPYEIVVTSAWRPPEHNESVSVTPISNHQLGEAMDTAPAGTWGGHRNPLGMLAHHTAAQTLYPERLRELLLEDNALEYTMQVLVDESVRTLTYSMTGAGVGRKYWLNRADGTQDQVQGCGNGMLGPKLLARFFTDYGAWRGASVLNAWPNPLPTYLQLYIFALTVASHVHLTWKRPP